MENVQEAQAQATTVPLRVQTRNEVQIGQLPAIGLYEFNSKIVRQAFARKVFLLMTIQLVISCLIVAPLIFIEPIRKILNDERSIFIAAIILFWVLYSLVVCSYGLTRSYPHNYILLILLTVSISIVIACTCAMNDFKEILIGLLLSVAICFMLAGLASIKGLDFTILINALSSFLLALLVLITLYFVIPSKFILWLILSLGMLLLALYFIVDLQIIMKGKHRYLLTPEDHVVAATLLYVDIVYIFIFMLSLVIRKA